MSDNFEPEYSGEPEITPELIAHLKSTEHRYRELSDGVEVETDLRDNVTIKALMANAKANFDAAIAEIIEISPLNSVEIARCLVNIKTLVLVKRALEVIISRGVAAERSLRADDHRGGEF